MRTLLGASVKMVVRDHQAIFWALMFPMILLGVFRLFSPGAGETSDVLLVADTQTRAGAAVAQALQQAMMAHIMEHVGFQYRRGIEQQLGVALERACALFADTLAWQRVQKRAMTREVGWAVAAAAYLDQYQRLLAAR